MNVLDRRRRRRMLRFVQDQVRAVLAAAGRNDTEGVRAGLMALVEYGAEGDFAAALHGARGLACRLAGPAHRGTKPPAGMVYGPLFVRGDTVLTIDEVPPGHVWVTRFVAAHMNHDTATERALLVAAVSEDPAFFAEVMFKLAFASGGTAI